MLWTVRRGTDDYPGAARDLEEARVIHRETGNPYGETEALNEAGTLHRVRGALQQAASCHRQALDLAQLRQALEIFQRIGAADAADLATELDVMRAAAHPAPDGSAE